MTRTIKLVHKVDEWTHFDKRKAMRQWKNNKHTDPCVPKMFNPATPEPTPMGMLFVEDDNWFNMKEIQKTKTQLKNKWKRIEIKNFT
jgi:hypothetical protein